MGGKTAARAEPVIARHQGSILRFAQARFAQRNPVVALLFVGRVINLAHARIQRCNDARLAGSLCQRLQGAHAGHRQICTERQTLCHTAGDAHTGERAGAFAEGDAIDTLNPQPRILKHIIQHLHQQLGMFLPDQFATLDDCAVLPQRDRAVFGGSF